MTFLKRVIYLKSWMVVKGRGRNLLSAGLLPKLPQQLGLRPDNSQVPEIPSWSVIWVKWVQILAPSSAASQDMHWQGAGLEVEQPGRELVLWHDMLYRQRWLHMLCHYAELTPSSLQYISAKRLCFTATRQNNKRHKRSHQSVEASGNKDGWKQEWKDI